MSKYAGKLITFGATGGNSVQFPGVTTAYLETPWNAAFTFGTGNWTIEAWVYPTSTLTQVAIISNWTATAGQFQLHRTAANRLEIVYNLNGTTTTLTGTQFFILPNRWTHVCVMRSSSGVYMLVNGAQDITASVGATAITGTGQVVRVGVEAATVNPFLGFISNVRIVVGTAVYSVTQFRVPMQLEAVTNTQYLVCASPTFLDISGNFNTVTVAGTAPVVPQVSTFTPYGGQSPLTSSPTLGTGPTGVYRSSDMATYSVNRAIAAYDPYGAYVTGLINGIGASISSYNNNNSISAVQNYSVTPATSTSSGISGNNVLTVGGTVAGTFAVGMPVTGVNLKEGRAIAAYGTGTGGAGTYLLTDSQSSVSGFAVDGVDGGYYVTRTGNTTQGAFSPFSNAGWGFLNNNAAASFLQTSGSINFAFGTGDYTIEYWILFPVVTINKYIFDFRTANTLASIGMIINSSSQLTVNGIALATSYAVVANRWYHVAVCRSGGTARLYVDGAQAASIADSTIYNSTGNNTLRIAAGNDAVTASSFTNLAMSNLRVIKGQALYTGAFTPPIYRLSRTSVGTTGAGVAASITGTVSLLTLQDNRFVDNSGNNVTVTPTGNTNTNSARIITYAPIYANKPYSPGSSGGSHYFPGGSAYLTMAGANTNCAFGTGDFTIECWIYPISIAAVQLFFDTMGGTTTGRLTLQYEINQSVSVTYNAGANFLTSTAGTAPLFAWTHVYLGRVSGTSYLFINGVQQSTTATNPTFICDANRPVLGTNGSSLGSNSFTGYISGLRITRVSLGTTTVPTVPPQMVEYTALLMNGATGPIYDSFGKNNYLTAGSTTVSTSVLPPTGTTSAIFFNGTTDYLQATNPFMITPTGDFTIELWMYQTSVATQQTLFSINGNNNSFGACRLDTNITTGVLRLLVSTDGTTWAIDAAGTAPTLNAWNHVAVVRAGANFFVYLNGRINITSAAVAATTALMTPITSRFAGLRTINDTVDNNFFAGRMADIRVTQWARYAGGNFLPPTSEFQNM